MLHPALLVMAIAVGAAPVAPAWRQSPVDPAAADEDGPGAGEDDAADAPGEIEGRAVLHLRATGRRNEPRTDVRLDPATAAFDVSGYLRPSTSERYLSTFLSADLRGRHGEWRWELRVDSGEVRAASFAREVLVCGSSSSPSGLALVPPVGVGACALVAPVRGLWSVPGLANGPSEIAANFRPAGEEARASWFLREAWLGTSAGQNGFAFLRAGRHRFTVGDGFVYDDHGLGLEARLDLGAIGPPWDLGASLLWPSRDWPGSADRRSLLLALRADRMLTLFDHVGVFAAYAHDDAGDVPGLFRGAEIEDSVFRLQGYALGDSLYQDESRRLARILSRSKDGSADIAWLGLSGNIAVAPRQRVAFTAALSTGKIRFTEPASIESTVLGTLVSARWEMRVHRELLAAGRFLWISGDAPPSERARLGLSERYGGFLGIAPWVTATNLFFSGGLSETFAGRQASAPGVNGRGVYGPIAEASWEPSERLRADLKAAYLVAPVQGPYGGRVYGPEVDLNLRWAPRPWIALSAEADALWPGDFFGGGATVRKLILAVDLATP